MDSNDAQILVSAPAPTPDRRIVKRAVIYSVLFDLSASFGLGAISAFIYMVVITGGSFIYYSDLQKELVDDPGFKVLFFVLGTIISIMAGFLAAQIGKYRPYAHAVWAGSILVVINFITSFNTILLMFTKTSEIMFADVFNILIFPFGLLSYLIGAHLYKVIHNPR